MITKKIGIVDYGVGNHTSVIRSIKSLGYRCFVSSDHKLLANSDLIILPGVGAFSAAMTSLHSLGLVQFLQEQAKIGMPMLGLCLGMQLMAEQSFEHGVTNGIGIIPGQVMPLRTRDTHIGWNKIEVINNEKLIILSNEELFYFNHSFVFHAPYKNQICITQLEQPITAAVRCGKLVGLQFHPEKSQHAGKIILKNIIEGLTND